MSNVVFQDTANGGYYCSVCKLYIHPDLIHIHNAPNHGTPNLMGNL